MRVLGLIPARGGSKRLPRKALRLMHGKPLLAYAVDSARNARRLARVILSTDDHEIAEVGRRLGVDVPFLRPAELALDTTPMIDTVQHALAALDQTGDRFDAVCLLQPTAPLRTAVQIDGCIDLLEASGSDAVVTVMRIPSEYHPDWAYRREADGTIRLWHGGASPVSRGQDLTPAFCRTGDVYVTRRDVVMELGTLYGDRALGFIVDAADTVNIDTQDDWERAAILISQRRDAVSWP